MRAAAVDEKARERTACNGVVSVVDDDDGEQRTTLAACLKIVDMAEMVKFV